MRPNVAIKRLLVLSGKGFQHFGNFYIALESGDELALFIVERLKGQAFDLEKRGQEEFGVPAHFNICVAGYVVCVVKFTISSNG